MDLLRCEMCNSTVTNFFNHRCLYHKYSYQVTGFENPDCIFGNNPQKIPATISHSAVGAKFHSSAFMNRTSTPQSSTFHQSTDQERHWDVNSTASTDVRYSSSNAVQNENFNYFNSSQGIFFPPTQRFENSACTSGVENLKMPFFNAAYTSELNPVQQPCTNNSALMQRYPNLSFYNQLPPNSAGPSNGLTKYDLTIENFNIWRSMESGKTGMPDFKISRFQEKEYDAVAIARKSNGTEKNKSCASHLHSVSLNVQHHGNRYREKKSRKKIHPCHKTAEVCHESSAVELQKIRKSICEGLSCNVCSKKFPNQSSLDRHILTHTGEKPISCEICGKMFSQKSNKNVHTLTHYGIKRFQCNICGKSYTTNQNLFEHKHKQKHLADN